MNLHEAGAVIGGQFRLAGLQPRRGQILDLLDWYERQFEKLGVTLHLNSYLDEADIAAHPADQIFIATGSLPDDTGFRRWVPHEETLPGMALGHVWSPEAVLRREARLGDAVILYDEGGNWRGVGTAWALAEQGKKVLIVTPETFVGKEIARTAADGPARRRMAQLGVQMRSEHMVTEWHGNGATIRNLLTGKDEVWPASDLVMATTNTAFDPYPAAFSGKTTYRIGDCAAPRLAAYAIYEGRKFALGI